MAEGNECKELSAVKDNTILTLQKALITKDSLILSTTQLQNNQETELFLTKVDLTAAKDTINLTNLKYNVNLARKDKQLRTWKTVAGISIGVNVAILATLFLVK